MKWGAVTTAKAAGGYVITQGVNEAGDEVTGRGRLLAEGNLKKMRTCKMCFAENFIENLFRISLSF